MKDSDIHAVLRLLRRESNRWRAPVVTEISHRVNAPFAILVSTLLSLRTQDRTTRAAATRLLQKADTPQKLLDLSEKEIRELIYPVGFYRKKAALLREVAKELMNHHGGRVPSDLEALLRIRGVGRKTANLVVTLGFGKPGICVDTHVHRISNRLGYVSTRTPDQTEVALRAKLPRRYWISYNDLLVAHGQNICKPLSPLCSQCPLEPYCDKVGVNRSR